MRRYDDPVEVRRGLVPGAGGRVEGPEQFLWRGRLWKVSDVVAHWVETGAWWQSGGARALLGAEESAGYDGPAGLPDGSAGAPTGPADLTAEREVWRVQAARGLSSSASGGGVFDLVFDWTRGSWRLARAID